jgi:hypothetical protein
VIAGRHRLAARTRHAVSLRQAGRKHLLAAHSSVTKSTARARKARATTRARLATNAAAKPWQLPEWVPFALAVVFILLAFSAHGFSTLIRRGPTPPPTAPL